MIGITIGPKKLSWARLLKRVFDIDIKHRLNCGGALKIIVDIEEPAVISRIHTHVKLARLGTTALTDAVI